MTRILHIIDHIYPVLGYQETHLAKAHSNGNQTLVITSDRYSKYIFDSNKPLLKKRIAGTGIFQEYGIDLLRLPIRLDIDFLNSPWLVGLENAVQNFKPDIIIAHGFVNLTSIRLALLKRRLPHTRFIFDDHMTFNATRGTWTKLLYIFFGIFLTPIFLKSANEIIAVTPETKEFMHQKYRIPEAKIRIVSLGIDLDNFYYDPNIRQVIRKQFSI